MNDINEALNIVTRALSSRPVQPILECVLIQGSDDGLQMSASDGSLSIQTRLDATIAEGGSAALPGKLLADMARRFPAGELEIRTDSTCAAELRCGRSHVRMAGQNPMEYPDVAEVREGTSVEIPCRRLRDMISRVVFSIATDESRQILTGCLLEITADEARLVALDGFRLAMQALKQPFALPDGQSMLRLVIPGRVMSEISRILPDSEDPCRMTFDRGHLTASFAGTTITTVLLAGEYIDYRRILPPSFATNTLIDRVSIQNAIDRASLMASVGKNNLVRLSFRDDRLTVTSNAELGNVVEEMEVEMNGDPIDIAFNAKYLTDAIRNIAEDELCMRFNTNVSPSVISPREGQEYLYLILPVRVNN